MITIGILAGSRDEFYDWVKDNVILPHPNFVVVEPDGVRTRLTPDILLYKYIDSIKRAQGLELTSIIKTGQWYLKWSEEDLLYLQTRIRP